MSLREFWIALQFLTRLPTPRVAETRSDDLAKAVVWFPAAGLVIGACLAVIARLLHGADPWLVALAVLAAWIWITGALHLDGLGDVADAFGAAHGKPERFIAVLGDPHAGSFAVVAIALQIAAKLVLIAELATGPTAWALVLIPAWARLGTLVCNKTLLSLKPGLGASISNSVGWNVIVSWGAALAVGALAGAVPTLLAIVLMPAVAFYWQWRIGGITGDCHGASIEVMETLLLVACVLG
ncbi:adenosylcobinamide-GDP ribazoletransferase [Bradyrhizobium sp. SSBR45G]|uniref:adenosylcobinamide-GDP ribazoletransferase n=1 Tax=unclassified Bradyrhizobium TaxID=2631580 RepID=UPI00234295DF|nr:MULTISPECIES: adenosylcobinamide-GDP ribazoletransferase [unclassified Bradyrhizobium]GLH79359.1 adenosylcobinamide-GDP ribazoletransferase [Bradyrhizobium sp. SSBR45G]GLH86705.1 adenosylcobinamide-GDP ribazoletransferase [Bradyrhizobium sp. SSBR45R]